MFVRISGLRFLYSLLLLSASVLLWQVNVTTEREKNRTKIVSEKNGHEL